jgi:methylenetetrahydrofolate dehydrogenase (NADP+)/methenyltetrahydrofolate cyclohydrolase
MLAMIIDGRALAEKIYAELKTAIAARAVAPHLTIFTCAPDTATQQYLALKKRKASSVGIDINVIEVPENITTEEMVTTVTQAQMQTDGIVVQLPLPKHLDTSAVLNAIPSSYDADGMHYDGTSMTTMNPVVAAIARIALEHDVLLATQQVVVVGQGGGGGRPPPPPLGPKTGRQRHHRYQRN